eukprot:CAMPEP_0197032702 /NCGR_PEP_ID=MMETSP1384-20130603/11311_1 /TAXON_ID=29189 /ORGANISM="Ammonia sp." /LENGTH=235 /DNA_ID=CAMNT_0042462399 /DNA_START=11 /DNA_END=714 /DNA_ORIENTATION=+
MDSLLSNDSEHEEEATAADGDYYRHESGPFSKKDGSYRHRHDCSPKHPTLHTLQIDGRFVAKPQMTTSVSAPDFSLYSQRPASTKSTPTYSHVIEVTQSERYQQLLRDIIKGDVPFMSKERNSICPHRHHCIQNAIMKGFFRTFSAAFIFKTSLTFFTQLFAGRLSWKRIRAIFLDNDSVLFGIFVGLMSFTYKVILCALRRIRKKDPIYHKTIAGFLSGLWILIDDKTRRQQIA